MGEEQARGTTALTLFYSYVDKDKAFYHELETHLRPLQRDGLIAGWHHHMIIAGSNKPQAIKEQLEAAQLILLLMSPDFLASNTAYKEMEQVLHRERAGLAHVILLLVRPVVWQQAPITHLRVLPHNGKAVILWRNRDQAYVDMAKEIYAMATHGITPFPFIFLSYAKEDYYTATNLKDVLIAQDIAGWIDQSDNLEEEQRREAIRNASAVILLATAHTQRSSSVKFALQIAEIYQRTIYVLQMGGNQLDEVVPPGCHNFTSFDARGSRYQKALEELLQAFRQQTIPSLVSTLPAKEANAVRAAPRNPYKGLQAFRQEDAADFFGRDRLIGELVEQLRQMLSPSLSGEVVPRLLTVVGASGSGKSSVVMAGLLPRLRQGVLTGSEHWLYLDPIVPGPHPLAALISTLSSLLSEHSREGIQQELEEDSMRGLHLLLTMCVRQATMKVILLVDQFEELFTQTFAEQERRHFLDLLLTAVTEPNGPLVIVLTLRADFYDRPLQYPELAQLIKSHQVTVSPLEMPDLRRVIEQPARLPDVQLTFEEDLVGDLLFEVQGQPGALLLLQFTLDQLFQQREDHTLTRSAYAKIGGVRGAIAQHAERTYWLLASSSHRELARTLFLRLINPGTVEQEATKRRIQLSALTMANPEEAAILTQVRLDFTQAGLLTTNMVQEVATVEVSHEALINTWGRLAQWLRQARNELRLQQTIGEAATRWLREGESTEQLYRGSQLTEALAWREAHAVNREEDQFLQASLQQYQLVQRRERQQRMTRRWLLAGLIGGVGIGMTAIGWLTHTLLTPQSLPSPSPLASAPTLGLPYTYEGHTDSVMSVVWSPDSERIASASSDKTVQVWDANSSTRLFTYKGHTDSVRSIAWSPDGKRIVSASYDKTVQVWDANSGARLFTYGGRGDAVGSVAWSSDGKRIASAGFDKIVQIWDVNGGNAPLLIYKEHASLVRSVAWSPDSKRIASGSDDGMVHIWDASLATTLSIFKGRTNTVESVVWSPDGKRIAVDGDNNTVQIWDVSGSSTLLLTYKGHTDPVRSLAWEPSGRCIASAGWDKTVQVWNASVGALLFAYKGHSDTVWSVAWDLSGRRIASGSFDRTVQVWNASRSDVPQLTYKGHTDAIGSVAWEPTGLRIASGGADKTLQVWNASLATPLSTHKGLSDGIGSLAWEPKGSRIAFTSGAAQVWDVDRTTLLLTYEGPTFAVENVAWSPDGKRIAAGGGSNRWVYIWDASNAHILFIYKGHIGRVNCLAWEPSGNRIASSSNMTVQVWDTSSGAALLTYNRHTDHSIYSVAWSQDGKRIASGGLDKMVHIWDTSTATPLSVCKGHTNSVKSVAWEPSGKRIASAGDDGIVRVWDASLGTLLSTYRGHTGHIYSVVWSPDGKRIASAGSDATVKIWYVF